jgi:hypothetical protein
MTLHKNKIMTATEIAMVEQAKYRHQMIYKMAKALITGHLTHEVIKWAEMEVSIYEKELTI